MRLKEEIAKNKTARNEEEKSALPPRQCTVSQVDHNNDKLRELHFELLPHPPYSPNLASSDYWLFTGIKRMLQGKEFDSNEDVILETEGQRQIVQQKRYCKVKVQSPDGDTEYFNIVAGVLQGDTLATYLFIICLDYVLRTSIDKIKENGIELTKKRSRRYPAKAITDADYADDIAILANTPDQAETLLHSLERAAAGIGLYVNAHKTEYMCYNQTGDISTLEGTPLKLVDKFTYLGSSVSSTEKDIETRLTKA